MGEITEMTYDELLAHFTEVIRLMRQEAYKHGYADAQRQLITPQTLQQKYADERKE